VKNSRADFLFQGKRKLFKILNNKWYFNTVRILGQICFSVQAQVAQKYWMQKYIQSSEKFQGTLCFSGEAQVAQILNDKKYIQYSEKL